MNDRQVGEQRQDIESGLWANENVQEVLPAVTMASTGTTTVSEAMAVDVRRFYGNSEQQPGFVVTSPYSSGSSRDLATRADDDAVEEDEGSSSSDSDNEPLAKIAKMGKIQSSPNSKNPKKPRKATGPRTPTAYSLFVREHQPAIMSKQSGARPADVLRIVRALWKGMDAKSRKPYTDAAKAAKVRLAALPHGDADDGILSIVQELRSGSEASAAAVPESGAPAARRPPSEIATEKRPPPAHAVPPAEALGVSVASAIASGILPPEAASSGTSSARAEHELDGTVMTVPHGSVDAAAVGSTSRVLSLLKSVAPVAVSAAGTAAPIAASAASRGQAAVVAAGSAAAPTDSIIPAMAGSKAVKAPPSTVAPSLSPQVVHFGVPTLSLLSPVEASQLPRMPLRTAATAGRHQVVTNGGTKVIIIAQQSNGIGITQHVTQRPLRLISLGTQGTQAPAGVNLMPAASGVQPESVAPSKPSSAAFSVVALQSTSGGQSTTADCGAGKIGSTATSVGWNSTSAGSVGPPRPVAMSGVKCDFAVASSADATKLESEHRPTEVVSGSVGEESAHDMDTTETTHTSSVLPAKTEVRRNTCLGCGRTDEDAASSGDISTKASQGAAAARWKYDGYCSSRCTVDHCKNVFNAWVARRRLANNK